MQRQIEELETKLAFQEDTIEQLNQALQSQQLQLDIVQQQLKLLAAKIREGDSSPVASQSEETPPPHY